MYTISALWTQARERLNITTIILKHSSYGILRVEWELLKEPGPNELHDSPRSTWAAHVPMSEMYVCNDSEVFESDPTTASSDHGIDPARLPSRVRRIVHRSYRRFPMAVLDHFRLDGKVAVVTGASSGLGVAFAVALAEAGADVALGARRVDRLAETAMLVETAGRRSLAVATDVSDPDACTVLVESAMGEFGRVDVLVNNAGVGTAYPATRETPEQFREVVDINLNGSYWMAQACARVMQPGSAIINIGSVMGFTTGELPQAAYCSTKAAIVGLTRDLAQQWSGRKGIRVNALAPGFFVSEMTGHYPEGYMERMIEQRVPLKRAGEAEELCTALIFLASDAGSYVNGITLPVDGGLLTT